MRSPLCASCRLRSLIHTKEASRTGRIELHRSSRTPTLSSLHWQRLRHHATLIEPAQRRSFGTHLPPVQDRANIGGARQSLPLLRKPWLQTSRRFSQRNRWHEGYKSPSVPEYTKQQFGEFIESLYRQGAISRAEWRHSVLVNAGLKRDTDPVVEPEGEPGMEESQLEERVGRLKNWFAEQAVPEIVLEADEKRVYERLFGNTLRTIEVEAGRNPDSKEDDSHVLDEDDITDIEQSEEVESEVLNGSRARDMGNNKLHEDIRQAMAAGEPQDEPIPEDEMESRQRAHPLTLANRFTTFPSTIEVPPAAFTEPVTTMLTRIPKVHLSDAAHRIFGGPGLPYSTATPARGKSMQQKPIPLDASLSTMSEVEADVYMSTLMPGIYSSVMSILTETRRRLGTQWGESLVKKAEAGDLRVLDAGAGGAGALAVREMLKAEWERMHETATHSPTALAQPDGKIGGAGVSPPLGTATVLIGSDTLRKRVSQLLENTTFVPRLPDYIHTETAKLTGKFDLVIAPHTLWPLREDRFRRDHVQNLWSLLSVNGGVLLLLEKGVARGFELVAGAREMLLNTRVANQSPREADEASEDLDAESQLQKEPGMIIAPCTNHASCPVYVPKGVSKGRRDICAFEQRYYRPPFLQRIYGTKGKNHDDVEFSYLSIMRGRDLRSKVSEPDIMTDPNEGIAVAPQQDRHATDRAFQGYENLSTPSPTASSSLPSPPHSLSLPRLILPPLKRQGHVTFDVCTPAGTLERWTVPRSFSRQAYRDARKARWGDLWALGAKTRVPRTPKTKRPKYLDGQDGVPDSVGSAGGQEEVGVDEHGRLVLKAGAVLGEGGRVRTGRKVKGIRDKRDKKGTGNGRRKRNAEEG